MKRTIRNKIFHCIVPGGELLTNKNIANGKYKSARVLGANSTLPLEKPKMTTIANASVRMTAPLEDRMDFADT